MVNKLEKILNIAQDVLFEFDKEGTYLNIWTNNEALLLSSKSELIGRKIEDVLPGDHASFFVDKINEVIASQKKQPIEYNIPTPSGLSYFSGMIVPLNHKGQQTAILHAKDVTAEKHKDMVINDLEKVAKIGTWEYDPLTQQQTWSDQVYLIHDLKPGADVAEAFNNYDDESRQLIDRAIKGCITDKTPYVIELKMKTKRGVKKSLRATGYPLFDTNNKVYKVGGTIQDITQHTKLTRAFENQKVKLDRLVQQTPGVLFQIKRNFNEELAFSYVGATVTKMFGYLPEVIINDATIILDRIYPEDQTSFYQAVEKSFSNLSEFEWRGRIYDASGNLRWILVQSNPNQEADGTLVSDGIVFDITKRTIKENELDAKQKALNHQLKLASLGELAAGVAHEINNPLAIVNSILDRIDRHKDRDDFSNQKLSEMIQYALDASMRIEKITRGLSAFSRVDASLKDYFDITQAMKTTVELIIELYRGSNIEVNFNCDDQEHTIFGNRGRLDQVVMNLVANAKDAISEQPEGKIDISLFCSSEDCRIEVSDNGPGISKEIQDKIFDPFFSTKDVGRGTGIGLSIANSIVQEHDGKITLYSEPGLTKFIVLFPRISSRIGEKF